MRQSAFIVAFIFAGIAQKDISNMRKQSNLSHKVGVQTLRKGFEKMQRGLEIHNIKKLAELDLAVAEARGYDAEIWQPHYCSKQCYTTNNAGDRSVFSPSTNWSQGGPLIEELIDLGWEPSRESTKEPVRFTNAWSESVVSGPTLLIAACRAYVAAKGG
jgi:hypothetical protein